MTPHPSHNCLGQGLLQPRSYLTVDLLRQNLPIYLLLLLCLNNLYGCSVYTAKKQSFSLKWIMLQLIYLYVVTQHFLSSYPLSISIWIKFDQFLMAKPMWHTDLKSSEIIIKISFVLILLLSILSLSDRKISVSYMEHNKIKRFL